MLQGRQPIEVTVQFVYPRDYSPAAVATDSFALPSGSTFTTVVAGRDDIVSGRTTTGVVGGWDAQAEGLGGWSVDVHRTYEPLGRSLNGGDGSQDTGAQIGPVISTVAGNGDTDVLDSPSGIAVGADGALYIADTDHGKVWRRDPSTGTLERVGGGASPTPGRQPDDVGDGLSATSAVLGNPTALAFGPDGVLYIATKGGTLSEVASSRAPGRAGRVITTVAGTGVETYRGFDPDYYPTYSGDGGPATVATLSNPSGIAVAADGTLYIADGGNRRVRRVGTDGIITTLPERSPAVRTPMESSPTTRPFFNTPIWVSP